MPMQLPLANILGPYGLVIIGGLLLLLFGGAKIPELMRGIGRGAGELKKGLEEGKQPDSPDDKKPDDKK